MKYLNLHKLRSFFIQKVQKNVVRKVNNAVQYVLSNPAQVRITHLYVSLAGIVGYIDAEYASICDLSSQLGRVVLFIDNSGEAAPISYNSYKSRPVSRSLLSSEASAFADIFDKA